MTQKDPQHPRRPDDDLDDDRPGMTDPVAGGDTLDPELAEFDRLVGPLMKHIAGPAPSGLVERLYQASVNELARGSSGSMNLSITEVPPLPAGHDEKEDGDIAHLIAESKLERELLFEDPGPSMLPGRSRPWWLLQAGLAAAVLIALILVMTFSTQRSRPGPDERVDENRGENTNGDQLADSTKADVNEPEDPRPDPLPDKGISVAVHYPSWQDTDLVLATSQLKERILRANAGLEGDIAQDGFAQSTSSLGDSITYLGGRMESF